MVALVDEGYAVLVVVDKARVLLVVDAVSEAVEVVAGDRRMVDDAGVSLVVDEVSAAVKLVADDKKMVDVIVTVVVVSVEVLSSAS